MSPNTKTIGVGAGVIGLAVVSLFSGYFLGVASEQGDTIRFVEVPGPERIVDVQGPERIIEVPGPEVIVEVEGPERIVEVEVPGEERIIERIVEVPVEVVREVIVQVPGPERIVEVEVPVEVIVEVPIEVIVEVPATVEEDDLIIRGETTSINVFDWFTIVGEVYNNSSAIAELVQVVATFYDIDQNVVCVGITFTLPDTINPKEAAPFEISCVDDLITDQIASYKLTVNEFLS